MLVYRLLLAAGSVAIFLQGAGTPAEAHDRDCSGIVLNGCLSTAELDGGVGYGGGGVVVVGGGGGGDYGASEAFASAHAFAFARAFSRGHGGGGHGGGGHGGCGGGGHR
jgi:hypothetical protein